MILTPSESRRQRGADLTAHSIMITQVIRDWEDVEERHLEDVAWPGPAPKQPWMDMAKGDGCPRAEESGPWRHRAAGKAAGL